MSEDPVIDTSHLDSYLRSRHRVEVLNSAWKPALAGAAGAVAIIGAVVVGVWVAGPRFSYQTVVVPAVTMRDAVVPNIITKDIEIAIPRVVTVTPTEKNFIDSPAFTAAPMHGRIVPSRVERALSFDDGSDYTPTLPGMAADAAPYVGRWGYCAPITATEHFHCFVLMPDGRVISVPQRPTGRPT